MNPKTGHKTEKSRACWVVSAPGIPCGARVLGEDYRSDRLWLDVCIMGQHLPQMYPENEIHDLGKGHCRVLGLCEDCLGFGDKGTEPPKSDLMSLSRAVDEVENPCTACGGTGRTAMRVRIVRAFGATTAEISFLPHAYIPPLDREQDDFYTDPGLKELFGAAPDTCIACGLPQMETYQGEALHIGTDDPH